MRRTAAVGSAFFTTMAKLLLASLTTEGNEWEQAQQEAEDVLLKGGWKEHLIP
jgi:hypothetical protein